MPVEGHEAQVKREKSGEGGQLFAHSSGEWKTGGSAGQEVCGKYTASHGARWVLGDRIFCISVDLHTTMKTAVYGSEFIAVVDFKWII